MQSEQGNLFTREDTMFGVCQGLGQDLSFNPNWLRVALAALLFVNHVAALSGYVAAGALVAFSRWVYPNPRLPAAAEPAIEQVPIAAETEREAEPEQVPLAA